MVLRAKLCFERHVIFTISRSEIVKMTCLSKENSAAVGGENLLHNPHPNVIWCEAPNNIWMGVVSVDNFTFFWYI
ncbi:MAG: hypothetical protein RL386_1395 [Bacteroidota bacterium]